jgi:uncharacterized protein (TIGR02246 family)
MPDNDIETITILNQDYVAAVQNSDAKRFEEILAEDFKCTNPDSAFLDKASFLEVIRRPVNYTGLTADPVEIRLFRDFAIIHARILYTTSDGKSHEGRYTDDWVRREGKWICVSAHTTTDGWALG